MVDWNKPAVFYTVDDREVSIFCNAEGSSCAPSLRIENVPERKTWWMNIYKGPSAGHLHPSRQEARESDYYNLNTSTAMLKLTYEDDKLVNVEIDKGDE